MKTTTQTAPAITHHCSECGVQVEESCADHPSAQVDSVMPKTAPAPTYRIVTLSGRGLPVTVDADGYDTRAAAEAMAAAEHDGEYRIESSEETR